MVDIVKMITLGRSHTSCLPHPTLRRAMAEKEFISYCLFYQQVVKSKSLNFKIRRAIFFPHVSTQSMVSWSLPLLLNTYLITNSICKS